MRKLYVICLLSMGVALFACNGNSNSSKNNNTENETEAGNLENESSIDVDKPSDSKGVGEFKSVDIPSSIDGDMAAKGKEIFQTKCTVCHQVTDQKMIGPGLKGITKIRTPEWIMNMITNPDGMLNEDPVAKALLAQFNNTRMTDQGVTKEEARELYEYLRQNDAQ